MSELEMVEILVVEDNSSDAELMVRALKKSNIANHLIWLKDGSEALDFCSAGDPTRGALAGSPSSSCSI
ncbi:MAG: hypothetical protein ABIV42_02440 [Nitrosospira sp.]